MSTDDFHEALATLLVSNVAGLSSTTISRLKANWSDEYDRWQQRDLSARRFSYIWVPTWQHTLHARTHCPAMDGVYFHPRMAEEKKCVLVLIRTNAWGW
jgi:putative transposase